MHEIKTSLKTGQSTTGSKHSKSHNPQSYDMIVFCHLRWQFVYQRPQHLISRMAKEMKVLMVEEPIEFGFEERNTANLLEITSNLHVLQPKVASIEGIATVLPQYLR